MLGALRNGGGLKLLGLGVGVPSVGLTAWSFSGEGDPYERALRAKNVPLRLARDVYTAIVIVLDYKMSLYNVENEEERVRIRQQCHQRGADRLLNLCFQNGGIYIKLGQHIAQLDHLLPEQYVMTMRNNLLDKCPVSTCQEVCRIIKQDLGSDPANLFKDFEQQPIASASLAQVHTATHKQTGQKLAVKVQHEGLREGADADITTIEFLVKGVRYAFPSFDYEWLVEEVKHNLPKELDFEHEAQNAEKCRQNFASLSSRIGNRVVIPEIYQELSSSRVLTMEFMEGENVMDQEGLQKLQAQPAEVAKLISESFSEMIFYHGFVHCDPHAANLLVRRTSPNAPVQLVLLDHGLYKEIDDDFRLDYAGLWHSLIFADEKGIKHHSQKMNAGEAYKLFAAMLTTRPWDDIVRQDTQHLVISDSLEDKQVIQSYAKLYAKEISKLLLDMPRALLLLLKTNDCLRSIDRCLGQPINTFIVTARGCVRAMEARGDANKQGVVQSMRLLTERLRVEIRITFLRVATMFVIWKRWISQLQLVPL